MDLYISKKDGKFCIDHSLNDRALFHLEYVSGVSYNLQPVHFNFNCKLPFGMSTRIHFENIYSKNEHGCPVSDYEISASFEDKKSGKSEYITYSSRKALVIEHSNTNRDEKAFLIFWEIINFFDSLDEVKEIFNTRKVLEYDTPESLTQKLEALTKIVDKYQDSLSYRMYNDIVDWIRAALIRFGFSTQKLSQSGFEQFQPTVRTLNRLGYQVFKND